MLIILKKKRLVQTTDPYWNNVVSLISMNTAFTDVRLHSVTPAGGAVISTTSPKFGAGSGYFPYGQSSKATIAGGANFNFGADFTVEFWCKPTIPDYGGYPALLTVGTYTNGILIRAGGGGTPNQSIMVNNVYMNSPAVTVALNVWSHVAITRSGTTIRAFTNGTQIGSMTLSGTVNSSSLPMALNCLPAAGQYGGGYMDEVRVTKGIARYTSNFAVPTAPFPQS